MSKINYPEATIHKTIYYTADSAATVISGIKTSFE